MELLHACLMEGMTEAAFWELTPGAVTRFLKAVNERRKRDLQTEAALMHTHANLIGVSVSRLFAKNATYPSVEESFPGLFDYDPEEAKMRKSIENFKAFAAAHNAKIGAQSDGNAGDIICQVDS